MGILVLTKLFISLSLLLILVVALLKCPIMIHAGKSTTASMLAYVLKSMGDDLTAVVGAQVPQVSFRLMYFGVKSESL